MTHSDYVVDDFDACHRKIPCAIDPVIGVVLSWTHCGRQAVGITASTETVCDRHATVEDVERYELEVLYEDDGSAA